MSPENTQSPDIRPPHDDRPIWVQWPMKNRFHGITLDALLKAVGGEIKGFIRLHQPEFQALYRHLEHDQHLMHFNLQNSGHKPGDLYRIAQIYDRFPEDNEPALEPFWGPDMRCLEIRNNIPLTDLAEKDFKHSVPWIKNVEQLKEWILIRYHSLYEEKQPEELFKLGVGMTLLQDVPRWDRFNL